MTTLNTRSIAPLLGALSMSLLCSAPVKAQESWPVDSTERVVDQGRSPVADALVVYDDGLGERLAPYAAGKFQTAGGVLVGNIARWNGSNWSALSSGTSAHVRALTVHDDGTGPVLVAAGQFITAGGLTVNRVASWNDVTWSPLDAGCNGLVFALETFDPGSGPQLYAAGSFTTAGGARASKIATWDGAASSSLGEGANADLRALAAHDDSSGSGQVLWVAGDLSSAVGSFCGPLVRSFLEVDLGDGPRLLVGDGFDTSPGGDSYVAQLGRVGSPSPLCTVGLGLPGLSGAPTLTGSGALAVGTENRVVPSNAAPLAQAALFLALVMPAGIPTATELWVLDDECAASEHRDGDRVRRLGHPRWHQAVGP